MTLLGEVVQSGASSNTICLRGMEFFAYHGVMPQERTLGQRFMVDVDLRLVQEGAFDRDDLALTVDYSCVYAKIADVMTRTCRTIEYVAEGIARELLTEFPCVRVRVEVHKPGAPIQGVLGDVSVEVVRSNVWRAYLGLGSNLGDRGAYLRDALGLLGGLGALRKMSCVYETEPQYETGTQYETEPQGGNVHTIQWFYNMVVELETPLPPAALLKECQRIEALCGRRKPGVEIGDPEIGDSEFESAKDVSWIGNDEFRAMKGEPRSTNWVSRTMDIDILMLFRGAGQKKECIHTADLIVPHPRLEQREFVLAPLREMAPDLVLPSGREVGHTVGKGRVSCLTEPVFSAEEF
ncbi:MAG: dihydroneopterin aldolase [Peptococcaceae bacterium]|nr:dihydroneopterin aldolase [Peptococcaceae bacterium]